MVASQITSVMHAFHDQSQWALLTVGKLLDCGVCCCLKVYNSRQLVYNMFSFLPFIFQTCLYHFKDMLQFKHIELVSSGHWRTAMYPCKWGIVGKKRKTQFKNTFKLKRKTSGFGKMQSTGILLPIALDYSPVTFLIFLLFYFRYQLVAIMETHSIYKWTSLWKIFQARLKRQRESFPLYLFSLLYIHFPLQYSLSWIFFLTSLILTEKLLAKPKLRVLDVSFTEVSV